MAESAESAVEPLPVFPVALCCQDSGWLHGGPDSTSPWQHSYGLSLHPPSLSFPLSLALSLSISLSLSLCLSSNSGNRICN